MKNGHLPVERQILLASRANEEAIEHMQTQIDLVTNGAVVMNRQRLDLTRKLMALVKSQGGTVIVPGVTRIEPDEVVRTTFNEAGDMVLTVSKAEQETKTAAVQP